MVKPRATIHRGGFKPGLLQYLDVDSIDIASWCPDAAAQLPPEQVHFILKVKDLDYPFVIRFKSPDTLGFLIEELARYRRDVWPAAEPLDLELNELR